VLPFLLKADIGGVSASAIRWIDEEASL